MADRVIKILTPASSYDLLSLDELKIAFGIPSSDTGSDEQFQMLISQYSDVIATTCNRVFGYEEVSEIWRCADYDQACGMKRLFLSHWPIDPDYPVVLESPTGGVPLDPASYVIEEKSGKIELFGTSIEPITVTYSGGYRLPDEAPPALKQAAQLVIREGQSLMNRLAISGIKSISHKDSRVMYFDQAAAMAKMSQGGAAFFSSVANSLLTHYIRLEV